MKTSSKGGRPTSYKPEFARLAFHLALLGATDAQIAVALEVSERTINEWKGAHDEFLQSLKSGKLHADARVAESLYSRAVGYSHEDTDIRAVALGNNQGSKIVQTKITKHYPPDVTACIFWLKNRSPNLWRDRTDHALSNPDGSNFVNPNDIKMAQLVAELLAGKANQKPQPGA